ncbi:reverse transcriptase [Phytophthora megakarya]|uniref:Reverse transcriptase n=1 Tax=Phytophthora megakarya TaxID=4795 RepID=A0A225V6J5_9STRA|nr:reverse transcriptase [Phytophthora megakarya]
MSQRNCTHCGSTKHDNLGCWKRLTCQKRARKGQPSDHCFFVCRGCGEMHEPGKCPMEEIWYEPSVLRSAFMIDDSQKQECVGIGENAYMTEGRTRIKITLVGAYVYYFDSWVGELTDQEVILGMDFMVLAGIRLDMAMEVEATTKEVTIDDIQLDDPHATPEECERLRRTIWKRRHLLIGAGNALPPAAFGAICDIDVGTAKLVAQRCRRVAPQFREKLSMVIKGLLSAKIITTSTSPWASPIVVIIKASGVDIRLCIEYQVVNSYTRLMVYPMPLINDLIEDLDKALSYCSLDMATGFWVQIVDNALYGHMCIKPNQDRSNPVDVCEEGEPEPELKPSTLGRRLYVDDILKELDAIANLPFPTKLKALQPFLGSLNYYSRFIEDFAVYTTILYKLRETDFHDIAKMNAEDARETRTDNSQIAEGESDRWAKNAFTMLKAKIIATPVLKHFDPERTPVIVLYANKWAISAALMQEHDGVYHPVTFTSRTLKANELSYGVVDKEVLALLRTLDVCYLQLETRSIKVLSRFSTLAWLLKSNGIASKKQTRKMINIPPPTIEQD